MKRYTGKSIIRAGENLLIPNISEIDPSLYSESMDILSSWRSCHVSPMESAFAFLQNEAYSIDRRSMLAKRLKRAPSIVSKLQRYSHTGMKLKNMQDIGGCRVIVSSEKIVTKFVRRIRGQFELRVKNNYIESPKEDGYRSVHLVGRFPGEDSEKRLIEVQARSAIQHSWATAVEITDLFTEQSIKTSQGKSRWRDFFKYASRQFAYFEGIPLFHQMDTNKKAAAIYQMLAKTYSEDHSKDFHVNSVNLINSMDELDVIEEFSGFTNSIKIADDQCISAKISEGFVLLEVDLVHRRGNS